MNSCSTIKRADFSLLSTVLSHGWYQLKPFEFDGANSKLRYTFSDPSNEPCAIEIWEDTDHLHIEGVSGEVDESVFVPITNRILRLDEDISEFHLALRGDENLSWVGERKAGRLLRSATVFEDLVKTICTTNCSWGLTKSMVANLVGMLGAADAGGNRAFPTPKAMASAGHKFYSEEMRAGYRSAYLAELAEKVAERSIDVEAWLTSELPTSELKREIKKVKGVGDYAAEHLLKLLGRYDGLALDSWLRSRFYKMRNGEIICPDKKVERYYKKYGPWKGLAIWFDMTQDWVTDLELNETPAEASEKSS